MKKTLRSAMLSTICMLVVAVMSLTGVTYAWFSSSTTADVTGMTMNVAAADGGFQVSKEANGPWSSTVDFNNASGQLKPVSTVNSQDFFSAEVISETAADNVKIKTKADGDANYWDCVFYARNTSEKDVVVYLASGAIFKELEGKTNDGKESYKAARIAVFVGDDTTPVYVWGNDGAYNGISGEGTIENCYAASGTNLGAVTNYKTALADCKITLPKTVEGEPQVKKITIRAWIEGQDTDCVNKNANDSFAIDIDFTLTPPTGN